MNTTYLYIFVFLIVAVRIFQITKKHDSSRQYSNVLEEILPVINGKQFARTITTGKRVEGTYKERLVKIEVMRSRYAVHLNAYMKPLKEFSQKLFMLKYPQVAPGTILKDGWITSTFKEAIDVNALTMKLDEFAQICERLERGEIEIS